MTTPAVGSPISLLDIQNEFGGDKPISISEYYSQNASVNTVGIPGIPASGTIAFSNFHNKSAKSQVTLPENTTLYNVNAYQYLIDRGWNGVAPATIIIPSTTYIGSTSVLQPSLIISGQYPNGLTLVNNGYIIGKGGQGGIGRDGYMHVSYYWAETRGNGSTASGRNGENGGSGLTILDTATNVTITNNGTIAGGGGGGGGGSGGDWNGRSYNGSDAGGGGGGGGAGLPSGLGGLKGYPYGGPVSDDYAGVGNGTNGSMFTGGGGGGAGSKDGFGAARWGDGGGAGGDLGKPGGGGGNIGFQNAGGGGAPGEPVVGASYATWTGSTTGTTYGLTKIDNGTYSIKLGATKQATATGSNVVASGFGGNAGTNAESGIDDGYWGPCLSVPWDWKLFGVSIKKVGTSGGMHISSNSYLGIVSSLNISYDMTRYENFSASNPSLCKILLNAGDRETRGKYVYANVGPYDWYYKVYYKGWEYGWMINYSDGAPYNEWEITFINPANTEGGKMIMEIRVNSIDSTTRTDRYHSYFMANADGTQYFDLAPYIVPGKTTVFVGDNNGYNWKAYPGTFYWPGMGDVG